MLWADFLLFSYRLFQSRLLILHTLELSKDMQLMYNGYIYLKPDVRGDGCSWMLTWIHCWKLQQVAEGYKIWQCVHAWLHVSGGQIGSQDNLNKQILCLGFNIFDS